MNRINNLRIRKKLYLLIGANNLRIHRYKIIFFLEMLINKSKIIANINYQNSKVEISK